MKFEFEEKKPIQKSLRLIVENYGEAMARKEYEKIKEGILKRKSRINEIIIFNIILDISNSMIVYYDELVDCVNDIIIPTLKECAYFQRQIFASCSLFSKGRILAWDGFADVHHLGLIPLQRSLLDQYELQDETALYQTMKEEVFYTAAIMENIRETGRVSFPKGKIIVLTDGANNLPPKKETTVSNALIGIGKISLKNLQPTIGFFKTDLGLTRPQFETMAKNTGFQGFGFYEIAMGKSLEEKRRSFRHHFKFFSQQPIR